jgi:hypothetical protein
MIIQCISFGSAWWLRPEYDEYSGALIRPKSAFMNTTSPDRSNRDKARWCHRISGFIRINAGMTPYFDSPKEILQAKFHTTGLEQHNGSNRLLLKRRASPDANEDHYLVRVRSTEEGMVNFYKESWRVGRCSIVSASFGNGVQEILLLMGREAVIKTSLGNWGIICKNNIAFLGMQAE